MSLCGAIPQACAFAAVDAYGAIERHVLRLERGHPHAAPMQQTTQCSHESALAGVGCRTLNHHRRRHQ